MLTKQSSSFIQLDIKFLLFSKQTYQGACLSAHGGGDDTNCTMTFSLSSSTVTAWRDKQQFDTVNANYVA